MNLYCVHCGFYDPEISGGIYESHTNFFVVASDPQGARAQAKALPSFKLRRMHIDGLQEIVTVSGFRISPVWDESLKSNTAIVSHRHREMAAQ